ncbi:MAG TPA: glycosyl hydrolase family 28 protein, partial [Tepidisphaeraceae bacterium]
IYIKDVHIKNSPSFHVSFSGSNSEITIDNATVTAPSNAPNTDGIDVTGTNGLIKNTTVSVGDDNIVMKPQSTVCSNITISTCTFGSGHGVSIGGQTNAGMNGFFVSNCTFTGTSNGIHLKADRGDGGLVQNLNFSNLTMTNVGNPFDVSSYYINGGDVAGPVSPTHIPSGGTQMEAPVLADLPKTFVAGSTPQWQNITLSNIRINGTSSNNFFYGTPEALIQNLVLSDVTYQNNPTNKLNFVNDADVHLTGATAGPIQCAVVSSLELSGTPATPPTLTQAFSSSLATQATNLLSQAPTLTNFDPNFDPASVNTVRVSGEFALGKAAGTAGVYNLSGGSLVVGNVARIGDSGTGIFNQTGGTATIATLKIGGAGGGVGSWTISSGTASATSTVIQNNSRFNFNGGNVSLGALQVVTGGKALLSPGANKVLRSTSLSIDATSQIDLADNDMIIDYSGPVGTLAGDVRNFIRNSQLASSSATATTRLGYGDNAVLGKSTFAGQSVDTSSVLVKYTYAGDADLDGDADGVDIGTWATNFTGELGGTGSMVWTQGDWDYDGDIDGVDAGLWAQAFTGELGGAGLGSIVLNDPSISSGAAQILRGLGVTVVPEPLAVSGFALCFAVAAACDRRRGPRR